MLRITGLSLILLATVGSIYGQQIARAANVQMVSEAGTRIVLEGGISFTGGSNWVNNGETHLYKTTAPSPEGWLDTTATGVLDASSTGHVYFRGTNRQSFYGKTRFYDLTLSNPGGDTLLSSCEVRNNLHLDTGLIFTNRGYGNDSLLVSNPATTAISSSSNYGKSWVNGRLSRAGNVTAPFYLFPVGPADSPYAPIRLQKVNTSTATWTAEYNVGTPFDRTNIFNPPVDHISEVEYWEITSDNQASSDDDAKISLSWTGRSRVSANPAIRDSLIVAQYIDNPPFRWNVPGNWFGGNVAGADSLFGYVTSNAPSNNYTYDERRFTLGTISRYNALPVKLLYFTALADGNSVRLNWEVANEQDTRLYEIERSLTGNSFTRLGAVPSRQQAQSAYVDHDYGPAAGWNYYRIKITDKSGSHFYSPVRTVKFESGAEQVTLFPVPASVTLYIQLPSSYVNNAMLQLIGADGRLIRSIRPVSNMVSLNVAVMAAGNYFILVTKSDGTKATYSFNKL